MQVALVEDDDCSRRALARLLQQAGYEVISQATNGREALSALADHPAELIITDCQMPIMDGIRLTRTLRARGDATPIIMVSAQSEPEVLAAALDAGVTDYLLKPLNPAELSHAIEVVLMHGTVT